MVNNHIFPSKGITMALAILTGSLPILNVHATVIAVDNEVPATMNAGGTAENPAEYIIGTEGPIARYMSVITGDTTSYNYLTIQNGSDITNGGAGYAGFAATSGYNSITVTGSGSRWAVDAYLIIGNNGSNNSLTIENGGTVTSKNSQIGYLLGSNHNSVLVTGTGSSWTTTEGFSVGAEGSGNSLRVDNGGSVTAGSFGVGGGNSNFFRAGDNSAVISGAGSSVTSTYSSSVGSFNSGNSLIIEDGAVFTSGGGTIGGGNSSVVANNNSVLVTGSGSRWDMTSGFTIGGSNGSNNSLTITDGAKVTTSDVAYSRVGSQERSSSNSLLVSGTGSLSTGTLIIGDSAHSNNFTVENGATATSELANIGYYNTATNNVARITGTGSSWTINEELRLGIIGSNNSLFIENGATVTVDRVQIGYIGTNNTAVIKGNGSLWKIENGLVIGEWASQSMVIQDGATVINKNATIGQFENGSNSLVTVTGAGSSWHTAENLTFGVGGSNNILSISNGALVSVGGDFIMGSGTGTGNVIQLDGGFFAWQGNDPGMVDDLLDIGAIQLWDGENWTSSFSSDSLVLNFFASDEEAFAFTGFQGLGGYTILTTVPEPEHIGLVFGIAVAALLVYRRRKA